jgi:hypothetical protein
MKKRLKFILLLTLMLSTPFVVFAGCKAPKKGPPGPVGPQGPVGAPGALVSAYVTSFNQDTQSFGITSTNVEFPSNLAGPLGINHLAPDQFQVVTNGVYQINWILGFVWPGTEENFVFISLRVNGNEITGDRVGLVDLFPTAQASFSATTFSGSLYVNLTAGDIITLSVTGTSDEVDATIEPAFFSMALIALNP